MPTTRQQLIKAFDNSPQNARCAKCGTRMKDTSAGPECPKCGGKKQAEKMLAAKSRLRTIKARHGVTTAFAVDIDGLEVGQVELTPLTKWRALVKGATVASGLPSCDSAVEVVKGYAVAAVIAPAPLAKSAQTPAEFVRVRIPATDRYPEVALAVQKDVWEGIKAGGFTAVVKKAPNTGTEIYQERTAPEMIDLMLDVFAAAHKALLTRAIKSVEPVSSLMVYEAGMVADWMNSLVKERSQAAQALTDPHKALPGLPTSVARKAMSLGTTGGVRFDFPTPPNVQEMLEKARGTLSKGEGFAPALVAEWLTAWTPILAKHQAGKHDQSSHAGARQKAGVPDSADAGEWASRYQYKGDRSSGKRERVNVNRPDGKMMRVNLPKKTVDAIRNGKKSTLDVAATLADPKVMNAGYTSVKDAANLGYHKGSEPHALNALIGATNGRISGYLKAAHAMSGDPAHSEAREFLVAKAEQLMKHRDKVMLPAMDAAIDRAGNPKARQSSTQAPGL